MPWFRDRRPSANYQQRLAEMHADDEHARRRRKWFDLVAGFLVVLGIFVLLLGVWVATP